MIRNTYEQLGLPGAYSGINNLQRVTRKKPKEIKKQLESVNTYTTMREAKKPRRYNPYYVWEKRKLIQIDLIDYSSPKLRHIVNVNFGCKYLFCAIDSFTRRAWVMPMKKKNNQTCVNTFNQLLTQMVTKPQRILSDRGSEFTSELFQDNLEKHGIRHLLANFKAGTVERFQRSFQSIISKFQKTNNTKRFVDKISYILETYNNRRHRSIGMTPNEAEDPSNLELLRKNVEKNYDRVKPKNPRYEIGDKVRVQRQKGTFGRGYEDVFTNEVYNISEINETLPVPMYSLTSFDGNEDILARFYGNELQKVSGEPFEIRNIIKKEKAPNGIMRYYVSLKLGREFLYAWVTSEDITDEYKRL